MNTSPMSTPDYVIKAPSPVSCKNERGEWVPAIPEPRQKFIRHMCGCGRNFWTRKGYEGHYALKHILAL